MSHCKSLENEVSSVFGNDSNDLRTHLICGIPATNVFMIFCLPIFHLECTKLQTYLLFYTVMKLGLSEIKSEGRSKSRLEKVV